jgi:hypothetical protein
MHPYFQNESLTYFGWGRTYDTFKKDNPINVASHPHTNLKLRSAPGWQSVSGQLPGSESRIVNDNLN